MTVCFTRLPRCVGSGRWLHGCVGLAVGVQLSAVPTVLLLNCGCDSHMHSAKEWVLDTGWLTGSCKFQVGKWLRRMHLTGQFAVNGPASFGSKLVQCVMLLPWAEFWMSCLNTCPTRV